MDEDLKESLKDLQEKLLEMPLPRSIKERSGMILLNVFGIIFFAFYVFDRVRNDSFQLNFLNIFMLAALAITMIGSYYNMKSEYELFTRGVPVIAEVTDHSDPRKFQSTGTCSFSIAYNWNGALIKGGISYTKDLPEDKPEKYVLILIDPNKPEKHIQYDKGGYYRIVLKA